MPPTYEFTWATVKKGKASGFVCFDEHELTFSLSTGSSNAIGETLEKIHGLASSYL